MSFEAMELTSQVAGLTLPQRLMLLQLADGATVDDELTGAVTGWVDKERFAARLQVDGQEISDLIVELNEANAIDIVAITDGRLYWALNIPQLPRVARPTSAFSDTGPCSVYVFKQISTDRIKIGISEDPDKRRSALSKNHGRLVEIGTWKFANKADAYQVEQAAHYIAADHWDHGEWFTMTAQQAVEVVERVISQEDQWVRAQAIGGNCLGSTVRNSEGIASWV